MTGATCRSSLEVLLFLLCCWAVLSALAWKSLPGALPSEAPGVVAVASRSRSRGPSKQRGCQRAGRAPSDTSNEWRVRGAGDQAIAHRSLPVAHGHEILACLRRPRSSKPHRYRCYSRLLGLAYSDAVSKIEDGGSRRKISVTVGDRQAAMGDCLVTSATNAPFMEVSDGAFQHVDSLVLLALNCDRGVATATTPGASLGSPQGRDFQAKAEKAAAAAKQEQ